MSDSRGNKALLLLFEVVGFLVNMLTLYDRLTGQTPVKVFIVRPLHGDMPPEAQALWLWVQLLLGLTAAGVAWWWLMDSRVLGCEMFLLAGVFGHLLWTLVGTAAYFFVFPEVWQAVFSGWSNWMAVGLMTVIFFAASFVFSYLLYMVFSAPGVRRR